MDSKAEIKIRFIQDIIHTLQNDIQNLNLIWRIILFPVSMFLDVGNERANNLLKKIK